MAGCLRVEVHLVGTSPATLGEEWDEDETEAGGGDTFSRGCFAKLADGPPLARATGRLATGVKIVKGFRPGRLVTRTNDNSTELEWACRGPILQHLHLIEEWAVQSINLSVVESDERNNASSTVSKSASSSQFQRNTKAIAKITLSTPPALWRRGRFEPKDLARRTAVAAVFGHAAGLDGKSENFGERNLDASDSAGAGSHQTSDKKQSSRAGFCGVIGCTTHSTKNNQRGSLQTSLADLKPPTVVLRPILQKNKNIKCIADAGDDVLDLIFSFLDSRSAACLASTCQGFRDRMDCTAPGLTKTIKLHPHQRHGLFWMRRRERNNSKFVTDDKWRGPLFVVDTETEVKHPYWVDVVTGSLSTSPPVKYPDAPGGLLCDEPGLGKTVTALALTLSRRGAVAMPPGGYKARRCTETNGWYYTGAPRLAAGGVGDDTNSTPQPGVNTATPDAGGSLGSHRRSKRSKSSTPTGHFAAMERAAFEFTNPNTSAKRRKKNAAAVEESLRGTENEINDNEKDASPAPSRLGPKFDETDLENGAERTGFEVKKETPLTETQTTPTTTVHQQPQLPQVPLGFISLAVSQRRVNSENSTSKRNVAFFLDAFKISKRAVGLDPVDDVVEFILMNSGSGGGSKITVGNPLLLPKWRFPQNDVRPARVLWELGLTPASAEVAKLHPKDWAWMPPSESHSDGLYAFDVESLDEARSLAMEPSGLDKGNAADSRVYLSAATLVILPPVLISHWLEQIHFVTGGDSNGPSLCVVGGGNENDTNGAGLYFGTQGASGSADTATRWLFGVEEEGVGELTNGGMNDDGGIKNSNNFTSNVKKTKQTHVTLNSFEGLSAALLASKWDVVLMPSNRLSTEFSQMDTPLLKVHWQRVILDEGHQMGGASNITAKLSMACALKSHARWVMTGTPTPANLKSTGVGHLQPLLAFLQQAPYGTSQNAWTLAIKKPLERVDKGRGGSSGKGKGSLVGTTKGNDRGKDKKHTPVKGKGKGKEVDVDGDEHVFDGVAVQEHMTSQDINDTSLKLEAAGRLSSLLKRITIRTLKSDIRLPELQREVITLPFTKRHAISYNELVAFLRRSLILADWADPNHTESLLNPNQFRLASEAVTNLREAACVTGEFPITCFAHEIDETMDDLTDALCKNDDSLSREVARERAESLRYPLSNHRGTCVRCKSEAFMPMLTPCAHLLCSGCVAVVGNESERNVSATDANDFLHETRAPRKCPVCAVSYIMQSSAPREDNLCPRQPVPQDLIEIQPSYVQHAWRMTDALEAQGESTKVEYLLTRLRELGAAPSKKDRENERIEELGVETGVLGLTFDAIVAAGSDGHDDSSQKNNPQWRWIRPAHKKTPPKCIVYSGFRTHLSVIDLALTGAGVNFENIARMGMTRGGKDAALALFRDDPQVAVLLLDRAAAEGLDLSFVSRVFVMEPLDNASLEQQVVSRAHRMGQREVVKVEVLAMAGTAETTLLEVQQELAAAAAAELSAEAELRSKVEDESDDDEVDVDTSNAEQLDVNVEGRIASAALSAAAADDGNQDRSQTVAPAVAAEVLSRRRVLQSLRLVPVPVEEDEEQQRIAAGGDDVDAETTAAANAAQNVEVNRVAASQAVQTVVPPSTTRAPRRRVMFAEDASDDALVISVTNVAPVVTVPQLPTTSRSVSRAWTLRVRAVHVTMEDTDGTRTSIAPPLPIDVRLPLGGATTFPKLRDSICRAFRDAFISDGQNFAVSLHTLSTGIPLTQLTADGGSIGKLGIGDRATLSATLGVAGDTDEDPKNVNFVNESPEPSTSNVGHCLGGSDTATGISGVPQRVSPCTSPTFPSKKTKTGKFRGQKNKLGSSDTRVATGVGVDNGASASVRGDFAAAEFATAATAEISASPSVGRTVDVDALDRWVARRVASVAAADDISSAAMLRDPDGEDGGGGNSSAQVMALDLMRAAEAGSSGADNATIASLQTAFRSVVAERAAEASGNAKVSAAEAGTVTFQPLPDGRLVVRYSSPESQRKETTEITQDLPAALLPLVLRVVALDQSDNAKANLNPTSMSVVSPRVFWALVRWGGVGPQTSFVDALNRLAPNVADWKTLATRARKKPEKYAEYVSH